MAMTFADAAERVLRDVGRAPSHRLAAPRSGQQS